MLSLSQRSDRSDGRSDSGAAAAAFSASGGSGSGGGGTAVPGMPPRSPRRIMAGMTMDELNYGTTAAPPAAPPAAAPGVYDEPVTPTRPARSAHGTPLRDTQTQPPYKTQNYLDGDRDSGLAGGGARNNILEVAATATAMAASPLRRVELATRQQPQPHSEVQEITHDGEWGDDDSAAASVAATEPETNTGQFEEPQQDQEHVQRDQVRKLCGHFST